MPRKTNAAPKINAAPTPPRAPASPVSSPTIREPNIKRAAGVVTVGCKIQNGLQLQLCQRVTWVEETQSGPRERVRWDRVGKIVTVRGPSIPVGHVPGYRIPTIQSGFALTPGVDAEFMREWLEQNAKSPLVENGLIYVEGDRASAVDHARDMHALRSGMEPLDVSVGADGRPSDPRIPKPMTGNVSGVQPSDLRAAPLFNAETETSDDGFNDLVDV